VNPAFVRAKLAGADAYLRALMGERAPLAGYMQSTMGIAPQRLDVEALQTERDALERDFRGYGVPMTPAGRDDFRRTFALADVDSMEDELRSEAVGWVGALRDLLGDLPAPDYRIEVAHVDAYWANWIDGSVEAGVTLRVNRHPRIEYHEGSATALAAHEIAGHAAHVACLQRAAGQGRLDPCVLNLAVHSLEAFQMEGLAQTVMHLVPRSEPLSDNLALLDRYRDHVAARTNLAQQDLEDGMPIDEVGADLADSCPLSRPQSLRASLRDRSRDPLFRSYIHVYSPARRFFLQALDLSIERRIAFLQACYERLWTPTQLAQLLAGEAPDAVLVGGRPARA
jgi:hypothetical protein